MPGKVKTIIGWIVYVASLALLCMWIYWGINETFHEGWYSTSIWENLLITFIQYLSVPCVLLIIFLVAMRYKIVGALLFVGVAVFSFFFFNSNAGRMLIALPTIIFAVGYYFSNFQYKKWMSLILVVLPLLITLSFGIPQYLRVANRYNDSDFGTRIVKGNNLTLVWAPQGDGFPLVGGSWEKAVETCAHLNLDGSDLETKPVNIWRLPSRDELVRSMTKENSNAGGILDENGKGKYQKRPDKETPLWNPHSQVIYYWTSELASESTAYFLDYSGGVWDRRKDVGATYQGFRCVRDYLPEVTD